MPSTRPSVPALVGFLALVSLAILPTSARAQNGARAWRVGDEVQAYINVDWMPATIVQVGGRPWPEYPYRVRYGQPIGGIYATRWLKGEDIRPAPGGAGAETVASRAAGPRIARYRILSYGYAGQPPIPLGAVELLPGGWYRQYDGGGRSLGEGRYAFDAGSSTVLWRTGPLSGPDWGGEFTVEREGKTHKIRLKRSTIAVHSTDS